MKQEKVKIDIFKAECSGLIEEFEVALKKTSLNFAVFGMFSSKEGDSMRCADLSILEMNGAKESMVMLIELLFIISKTQMEILQENGHSKKNAIASIEATNKLVIEMLSEGKKNIFG